MGVLGLMIVLAIHSAPASDGARRYALIIGANQGDAGESPLAYAFEDARRVSEVLTSVAGFAPADVTTLQNPSSEAVRGALASLSARIANNTPLHGDGSLLLVYYSGHADALSVHLSGTQLTWRELTHQIKASSAGTQLLVVDACRSGSATHVKGVRREPALGLPLHDAEIPRGLAIVTSASANELAQESDALQGSFFTHHWVAALRGAADTNGDGGVTLLEAFAYSAEQTAASTVATLAGVQHPTYRYQLAGHADLLMSRPLPSGKVASAHLVAPGEYVFRAQQSTGAPVLVTSVGNRPRWVGLVPGRYTVQRRTPAQVFAGTVHVASGSVAEIDSSMLQPVQLTRVAVKGSLGDPPLASLTPPSDAAPTSLAPAADSVPQVQSETPVQAPPAADVASPWAVSGWGSGTSGMFSGLGWMTRGAVMGTRRFDHWAIDAVWDVEHSSGGTSAVPLALFGTSLSAGARGLWSPVHRLELSAGGRVGGVVLQQAYGEAAASRWQLGASLEALARVDVRLPGDVLFVAVEGAARATPLKFSGAVSNPSDAGRTLWFVQPVVSVGFGGVF